MSRYLRGVRQVANDSYSPLAFDVCTDEEAKELDAREEVEARCVGAPRMSFDSPSRNDGVMTTAQLQEPGESKA